MHLQRLSDDAIAEQLGEVVRERRVRKDISQEQLAKAVGVSTPTIQKLEKGKGTIALLVATLRELKCLDLLAGLLVKPRVSPLAVMATGKARRVRASGHAKATASATNTSVQVISKKLGEKLLIPRKK